MHVLYKEHHYGWRSSSGLRFVVPQRNGKKMYLLLFLVESFLDNAEKHRTKRNHFFIIELFFAVTCTFGRGNNPTSIYFKKGYQIHDFIKLLILHNVF